MRTDGAAHRLLDIKIPAGVRIVERRGRCVSYLFSHSTPDCQAFYEIGIFIIHYHQYR